jgi:CCR4-NOT complex subunit CAF16
MAFLRTECETRGATVLCKRMQQYQKLYLDRRAITDATHIFDGLDDFATHVAHMRLGAFVTQPTNWPPTESNRDQFPDTLLYRVALQWLFEDRAHRRALEQEGRKKRGARRDDVGSFPSVQYNRWLTFSTGTD